MPNWKKAQLKLKTYIHKWLSNKKKTFLESLTLPTYIQHKYIYLLLT